MQIKIVRIDKSLPLPKYETAGSVAFDMYSRTDETIDPHSLKVLPSNLIIAVPEGHALILSARSSLAKKLGLQLANGIGIVDQDYSGPEDEIGLSVYNFTNESVAVKKGERLAQGMIVPVAKVEWEEVGMIGKDSRGGFGSTGK